MELNKEILNSINITPLIDTLKFVDIDDSTYFSDKYAGYLSNSRLGLLKSKGVKVFFEGFKSDYNASFDVGGLVHQLCLQPESYELIDSVYKPSAKAGIVSDYLYKADGSPVTDDEIKIASIKCNYYKDKLTTNRLNEFKLKAEPYWRDRYLFEQQNPPSEKERLYTTEKNVEIVSNCIKSINENRDIQELLHPTGLVENPLSYNEHTFLMDIKMSVGDESRIYRFKSKLDNFTVDKESNKIVVNDIKTTSKLAKEFDPKFFSYQREIAIYSWLLKLYSEKELGLKNPEIGGNFLVVSTIPNYNSLVYPMTKELFNSGWREAVYLLKCVAYFNIVKGYDFS